MNNKQLAYFLARLTLGINFFIHGLVRLPKMESFANDVAKGFENTMLPEILVLPVAYAIPIVELVLGLFLILGLVTKKTLTGAAILIIFLIAGSAFKEDWGAVGTQMLYALYIFFLLFYQENERMAIYSENRKV
ncbi:DoxX family protein [Gramella sp. MAR_2010_147]|uniref:DoxX family protein n=1 Tax=Gramella sp. MAR_2010_147 TaxID=1250205 RepID=UPI00087CD067|nr:DoxX family protein [Gramella sp. MAR_2010_147]SDS43917.1 thiosulfate dehydrogenase [quinone] large subunit [Gramella sp. MAR_2010_147]